MWGQFQARDVARFFRPDHAASSTAAWHASASPGADTSTQGRAPQVEPGGRDELGMRGEMLPVQMQGSGSAVHRDRVGVRVPAFAGLGRGVVFAPRESHCRPGNPCEWGC
jgi:hypothetical protein